MEFAVIVDRKNLVQNAAMKANTRLTLPNAVQALKLQLILTLIAVDLRATTITAVINL